MNHNLKIAFRNAKKNGIITYAKLFGLALSFAIAIFAAVYAWYEKSFDSFVPDKDKIYRVYTEGVFQDVNTFDVVVTSPVLADFLKLQVSEIKETMRVTEWGAGDIRFEEKFFQDVEFLYVDSNFFTFMGMEYRTNLENPFESKNYIALSESMAIKVFGTTENILDTEVKFRGNPVTISAIYKDFPKNSHLQYPVLTSINNFGFINAGFNNNVLFTYLKTKSTNVDNNELDFKITKALFSSVESPVDAENAQTMEDLMFDNVNYTRFRAEPLQDIHFSSHRYDCAITSNKTYVNGAIILAIFVLLISSINYLNLTIAGISTRMKEIAVKKSNGAFNRTIFSQFITETFIFWFVGITIAYILLILFAKPFENYLGFEININGITMIKLMAVAFLLLFIFNLIMNVLPLVFISRKNVLNLLKDESAAANKVSLRGVFVFLQFVFSGMIILGAISVNKQINYMLNADRGYDPSNLVYVNMWGLGETRLASFLDEMNNMPAIESATACQEVFGRETRTDGARYKEAEENDFFGCAVLEVDENFFNTLDIEFTEGRGFDKNLETDLDNSIIVNQLAMKQYPGYADGESVLDKTLLFRGERRVIGVVKDFNFRSLHHEMAPVVIVLSKNKGNVNIKFAEGQLESGMKELQQKWVEIGAHGELTYQFVDDIVGQDYESDKQAKKLLLSLSIISILIAALGLYAISYFTILKKTKDFAVRKINGASVASIAVHISRKFMILVASAFIISIPVSVYLLKKWLENFAYKTTLDWWIYAVAIGLTVLIAGVSIIWHVVKAATRNPVDSLRYE